MKIICGNCGAKYSIADEKVQGKVFKIRCRKCENIIVVKGLNEATGGTIQSADEPESQDLGSFGGSVAEWHLVLDNDQVGPVTPDEIEGYFRSGRISLETYIWREGMDDWQPLSAVSTFSHLMATPGDDEATIVSTSPYTDGMAHLGTGGGGYDDEGDMDPTSTHDAEAVRAQLASSGAFGSVPTSDPFGSAPANDPFGSAPANDPFGSDHLGGFGAASSGASFGMSGSNDSKTDGNDGMFSAFDSSGDQGKGLAYQSFGGMGGSGNIDLNPASSAPAPSASAGGGAGAGGNATENSFSNANDMIGSRNENSVLFSLSSLQQVEAVKGPASSGGPAGAPVDDTPVTDGSGLIDIRALASTHQVMKGGGPADAELISPATMSVPAIAPRGTHRDNKPLVGGLIAAVVLLAGVIGGAAYFITQKKDTPAQPQQVIVKEKTIVKEIVREAPKPDPAALAAQNAVAAKANETTAEKDDGDSKSPSTTRRSRGTSRRSTSSSSKPATRKSGVDDLLNRVGSTSKPTSKPKNTGLPTPKPASNLPDKPSKSDIKNTIAKYNGRVGDCAKNHNSGKLTGVVWVALNVAGSGNVSSATVASKTAGNLKSSDVASCVARTAKGIKFPASKEGATFTYPFFLR